MIRGQKRIIKNFKSANIEMSACIHNRFDIEVIDAATGKIKQRAQAENVICNNLWSNIITSSPNRYFTYIHYGSGTGTPSVTDSSLFRFVGYLSNQEETIESSPGVLSVRHKHILSESTNVGVTLTEVGVASSTSSSTLCTHAMLKDMNGNQISIVKTATDIINIYATIFVHYNSAGYDNGHIMLSYPPLSYSQYNYNGSLLLVLAGLYISSYPKFVTYPEIGIVNGFGNERNMETAQVGVTVTGDLTNKTVTFTMARVGASDGNFVHGIKDIYLQSDGTGYSSCLFTPGGSGFPKSIITGEAIGTGDGTTVDFSTKYGFVSNPVIYVDGVAQSGVSVDLGKLSTKHSNIFDKLIGLDESGNVQYLYQLYYTSGQTPYFENPNYETEGISSIYTDANVSYSNDFVTWTKLNGTSSSGGVVTIPEAARHARYWKAAKMARYSLTFTDLVSTVETMDQNIHFSTPPAVGAVITADYNTTSIAKDSNHVFDFTMTLHLNEYTGT